MCYIGGGRPVGSSKANPGSRDKTPPVDKQPVSLNFELYFAGNSSHWRGAPAFIRRNGKTSVTLGRMYLITDDQFNDVVMQENDRVVDGTRFVPRFEELKQKNEFLLPGNGLYGYLLCVAVKGSWPVVTFTTQKDLPIRPPSEPYIKVIASGIKETYPAMTNTEICDYLLRSEGISGRITPRKIGDWVHEA